MKINRAGRKPKPGARHPNGELKSAPPSTAITPALMHRILSDAMKRGRNPLLETQVGRMVFEGKLSEAQAIAAFKLAELYGKHDQFDQRTRSAKSPSYQTGRDNRMEYMESDEEIEFEENTKRAWLSVQEKIPHSTLAVLEQLCVDDKFVMATNLPMVRVGLDKLVSLWRIQEGRRKRA